MQVTVYQEEGGSPTAPGWVWGHSTQAADVGASATSQRSSQCGDAREVGQQVQTTQVEQLSTGSLEWEGLVSFLCPALKLDSLCTDTNQHLP